jgi:hypothetical protein
MATAQLDRNPPRVRTSGPMGREAAIARLHALLRVRREIALRRHDPEQTGRGDDLCHQAASDAVLAVLKKLAVRGEARVTWACKF